MLHAAWKSLLGRKVRLVMSTFDNFRSRCDMPFSAA